MIPYALKILNAWHNQSMVGSACAIHKSVAKIQNWNRYEEVRKQDNWTQNFYI